MKCECGCGEETKIRRGKPNRFIMGHNLDPSRMGKISAKKRLGKTYEEIYGEKVGKWMREIRSGDNNVMIKYPKCLSGDKNGRWLGGIGYSSYHYSIKDVNENSSCEKCGKLSRPKLRNFGLVVHHIDGNINNNTLENLQILCYHCNILEERK